MSDRRELLRSIYMTLETLNEDELSVVEIVCRRLEMGASQYGRLNIANDKRDWTKEAHLEAVDMAVYLAVRTLSKGTDR